MIFIALIRALGRCALRRKWRIQDERAIAAWSSKPQSAAHYDNNALDVLQRKGKPLTPPVFRAEIAHLDTLENELTQDQIAAMPYQQQLIYLSRQYSTAENQERERYRVQMALLRQRYEKEKAINAYVVEPPSDNPGYFTVTK